MRPCVILGQKRYQSHDEDAIGRAVRGGLEERLGIQMIVTDAQSRKRAHDVERWKQVVQIIRDLDALAITVRAASP